MHHSLTRRQVTFGLGLCCAQPVLGATHAPQPPPAIDVHHHYYPPKLLKVLRETPPRSEDPILRLVGQWTPQRSIDEMDAAGVMTAIVSASFRLSSIPLPIVAVSELTRSCNDYAADLRVVRPERFGFFAHLPLPHIQPALDEIRYGLDVLKADGVGLITSYGDKYLGDPAFTPVLEELDRRAAVAFVHPSSPQCCHGLVPMSDMLEYPYDTGRTFLSLLFSGSLRRYPRIRWILPHAGAALPVLAGRIAALSRNQDLSTIAPEGVEHELRRLHYDLANSSYQPTVDALLDLVPVTRILFGSDYPYVGVQANRRQFDELKLPAEQRMPILRTNAETLFPRLGRAGANALRGGRHGMYARAADLQRPVMTVRRKVTGYGRGLREITG